MTSSKYGFASESGMMGRKDRRQIYRLLRLVLIRYQRKNTLYNVDQLLVRMGWFGKMVKKHSQEV